MHVTGRKTRRFGLLVNVLISGVVGAAPQAAALACHPRVEALHLRLGGAVSRAEILRPPRGRARAIMVLVHGSDVADLDNSIVAENNAIVATPLKDVAVAMACKGIATIRYDKRFVSGPNAVDRAAFSRATLQDFLSDATLALDSATARADLARLPEMAFGWSEGTTVAAALAVQRPTIRALILQAPVITSFAASLQSDYPRVGATYMQRDATNGSVDAPAIARALAGPAGIITRIYVNMFKGFSPTDTINPLLDANHDGRIDIVQEATPVISGWFADGVGGGLSIYATAVALPGLTTQLPKTRAAILVLQGEADGAMDVADARALKAAHRQRVTVLLYPGLGHTLGPSASAIEDHFSPITPGPLSAMVDWALARAR